LINTHLFELELIDDSPVHWKATDFVMSCCYLMHGVPLVQLLQWESKTPNFQHKNLQTGKPAVKYT